MTALHVAARQGFPQICQMLLDAGANVHAEDADGYTPQDDAEMTGFQTGDARQVLQAAGALRHRAFSVLGNPGFGGQKARNSSTSAAPGGESKKECTAQADTGPTRLGSSAAQPAALASGPVASRPVASRLFAVEALM